MQKLQTALEALDPFKIPFARINNFWVTHLTMQNRLTLALYTEKSIKTARVPLVIQLWSRRSANLAWVSDLDFDNVNIYPPSRYTPTYPQCQGALAGEGEYFHLLDIKEQQQWEAQEESIQEFKLTFNLKEVASKHLK